MNIRFILRNWKSKNALKLSELMGGMAEGLDDFAGQLTDPVPTKNQISEAMTVLVALNLAALSGGADERAARDAQMLVCVDLIEQFASFVEFKTQYNTEVMLGCGFQISKERQTVGTMPQVINLMARATGIEGQMALKCKAVYGARFYPVQYCKANENVWIDAPNSATSGTTLSGLDPRVDYKFRMAAVGTAGQGPWSEAVIAFAA